MRAPRRAAAYGSLLSQGRQVSMWCVRRTNSDRHTPRKRGTQYAAAPRRYRYCLWNTGSPACAGDDSRSRQDTPPHSRRMLLREVCLIPVASPLKRAQGMPGARCAPRSRVQDGVEGAHEHTGHTGYTRHSPRNGFTAYFVLSPANRAFLPPSPAEMTSANLTPASGCQDHTTSPSASGASSVAPSASTAPHPAFVTIANAPFVGRDSG
jgi:hypothetical protein